MPTGLAVSCHKYQILPKVKEEHHYQLGCPMLWLPDPWSPEFQVEFKVTFRMLYNWAPQARKKRIWPAVPGSDTGHKGTSVPILVLPGYVTWDESLGILSLSFLNCESGSTSIIKWDGTCETLGTLPGTWHEPNKPQPNHPFVLNQQHNNRVSGLLRHFASF